MILVDTDIMIDVLRGVAKARTWLLDQEEVAIAGLTALEILAGALDKDHLRALRKFIDAYRILWPIREDLEHALASYGQHRLSHNLGVIDAIIGSMAIGEGCTLYTKNTKHFAALEKDGLKVIRPYR